MTLATDIATLDADTATLHAIIHGLSSASVVTEGGTVPTVAKRLLDLGTGTVLGAWVTATAYTLNQIVSNGGLWYRCSVAHTSGTFATDLAAFKWIVAASPVDSRLSLASVSASFPDTTGQAISATATDANFSGTGLYANVTGAHSNGVALGADMATTDGAAPLLARLRYAGNPILTVQPLRPNDGAVNQFQYDAYYWPTANGAGGPIVHKTNTNINIPTGVTISGEYLGHHLQVCRSHDNTTDSGTLNSLKALHITVGHDLIATANPTTTAITGINLRLRRNQGTIGNITGFNFELKEAGATITGQMYGLYDSSDVTYGSGNGLKHVLSGRTAFGSTGTPSESVDVLAGNVQILGTLGNRLRYKNTVAPAAQAVALGNVGPTGCSNLPQWWLRVDINGSANGIVPCWQYNS